MKNNYSIQNLLEDIARNAEADRAAQWLELAADDYPEIFGIIRDNLNEPPLQVLYKLTVKYPVFGGAIILLSPNKIAAFIAKLQAFYKERGIK